MRHSDFVHLHLHSQYSLLDGMIRPDALLKRAAEYKMPAVAVTDHGNMFGALDFYQKAMKTGVKPIIGCEVYVAPGDRRDKEPPTRGGRATNHHLVLLVKNHQGYKNLCKMLSLSYTEGFYYKPRIDKELLEAHNEGLIALSACLHGEVAYNINHGQAEKAEAAAAFYKEVFDGRYYLEIQDASIEEQKKVNEALLKMSVKMGLPLVATNDAHYLNRDDAKFHDMLLCVQTGKLVSDPNRMRFSTEELYFKSAEEMHKLFDHVPESLKNTVEIAERCNLELTLDMPHMPDYPLPEGETLDSCLDHMAEEGLSKHFVDMGAIEESKKLEYRERLSRELNVIKGMGFPGYFLVVADFINQARKMGVPVGPGRGSAAGSLAAYSLGITNVDPIKYNLLFERFLNPDRISLPDIDIDFCIEGREDIIKYVSDKYGTDSVGQIITFGQMRARAVIRDVGRVLDMTYGEVDRIAKLIPDQIGITIEEALKQEKELKKLVKDDKAVAELIEAAKRLEGLPRHASTHAAGVVIANCPLDEYLPLYMGKDGVVTTQYAMNDVEKIGLVKFDFLGLKTLTLIDRTLRLIRENKGVELDLENISLEDAGAYSVLSSGDTNGVFQCESSGMKELLKKLKPSTFEDVIAAVALYRPGPLKSGMVDDFIMRKQGKAKIVYDLPELESALKNTYGVIVYQEQVMEISRTLAGYTPGEADTLRKAMGKKILEMMAKERIKFLKGASDKKINKKKAEKIFDLMANFAEYGFNKSHSAAYGLIAYQTAFLKHYYRVEFMAALLTADMGDTDKVIKYMSECKESGITVRPPDINKCAKDFAVDGSDIVYGLGAVKNVGAAAIESIVAVRTEEPYESLLDFLSSIDTRKVNKKTLESLIKCGAFDTFGETRATHLASLETLMESAQSTQRDRAMGQGSIFDMMDDSAKNVAMPTLIKLPEWDDKEKLTYERQTLGIYLSSHPLEGHAGELERVTTDKTEHLIDRRSEEMVTIGGVIVSKSEKVTRTGNRMAILQLEDLHGSVEVIIFPKLYETVRDLIVDDAILVIVGRVDRGEDAVKIMAQDVIPLEKAPEISRKKVHIKADTHDLTPEVFTALKKVLVSGPGSSQVYLHLVFGSKREVVIKISEKFKVAPRKELFNKIKTVIPEADVTTV